MSYTHYPTISSDMFKQIDTNQFNNKHAGNPIMRLLKHLYYFVLMMIYKVCGRFADVVATNSSWTDRHIRSLWGDSDRISLIYPPCDTKDLMDNSPLEHPPRQNIVASCA